MNDELDAMLRKDVLQPPTDFVERVMKNLPSQIPTSQMPEPAGARAATPSLFWQRPRSLVARVGLASAGAVGAAVAAALGLTQLASFVFGLWLGAAAL